MIKSSQVLYEKDEYALKFCMNFKIAELLFEISRKTPVSDYYTIFSLENPISINRMKYGILL